MSQNLVEMAREKAMKKHRPTEFRETPAQQPQSNLGAWVPHGRAERLRNPRENVI